MNVPPLDVVVVAYGPVDLLRAALEALGDGFAVRLVDNGLSDEVRDLAETRGADYVRPSVNVGFGAAVNLGLARSARGVDVLLLNPDARLRGEDVLALQRVLHEQPRTAAVAPRLRSPDDSLEPTRWPMPTPTLPWRGVVGRGGLRAGEPFFLCGAVLLLSGTAVAEVGGFDERFFLYAEESDWQRRALAAGYVLREVPDVEAAHVGAATSSSSDTRERYFHGSAELFIRKWHGPWGWSVFRAGSLLAALRRAATASSPAARGAALSTVRLYLRGPASRLPPRPVQVAG